MPEGLKQGISAPAGPYDAIDPRPKQQPRKICTRMAERFINLWRHDRLGEVGEVFTDAYEAATDAKTPVRTHTYLMTVIVRDGDNAARVVDLGRDSVPYPGIHPADRPVP